MKCKLCKIELFKCDQVKTYEPPFGGVWALLRCPKCFTITQSKMNEITGELTQSQSSQKQTLTKSQENELAKHYKERVSPDKFEQPQSTTNNDFDKIKPCYACINISGCKEKSNVDCKKFKLDTSKVGI